MRRRDVPKRLLGAGLALAWGLDSLGKASEWLIAWVSSNNLRPFNGTAASTEDIEAIIALVPGLRVWDCNRDRPQVYEARDRAFEGGDLNPENIEEAELLTRREIEKKRSPSRARLKAVIDRLPPHDPWLDDEYDWDL